MGYHSYQSRSSDTVIICEQHAMRAYWNFTNIHLLNKNKNHHPKGGTVVGAELNEEVHSSLFQLCSTSTDL